MIWGFTGPRGGPSRVQSLWLKTLFDTVGYKCTFHHGACIGSDAAAHWRAIDAGVPIIVVHPPISTKYMMDLCIPAIRVTPRYGVQYRVKGTLVKVLPAKRYYDRDRDIVDVAERMVSTPAGPPTPHSGTWLTINYALSQHKPISLCYPDGEEDEL
jgi:hypothetical protein